MILVVCAVYDMKARAFASPFTSSHLDVAKRAFAEAANISDHSLCKYPEDFVLYCLGTWNDETAEFQLHPQREYVASALEYHKQGKSVVPDPLEKK